VKPLMYSILGNLGFFGILIFASVLPLHFFFPFLFSFPLMLIVRAQVPNPLFDLAGITCGHFLVPFMTFFGATLIGKAFFKAHIQVTELTHHAHHTSSLSLPPIPSSPSL
jgi:hypothetical protein